MQDRRLHVALWEEQERENIRVRERMDRLEERQDRAEDTATAERTRVNPVYRLVEVVIVGVKPYPLTGALMAVVLLVAGGSMAFSLATGASLSETVAAMLSILPGVLHVVPSLPAVTPSP